MQMYRYKCMRSKLHLEPYSLHPTRFVWRTILTSMGSPVAMAISNGDLGDWFLRGWTFKEE